MRLITQSPEDRRILATLPIPPKLDQPRDYAGVVVMKPWGYEFQVFDNKLCSIWLACLKPGQAVSMHCHQRKRASFFPLSSGITFRTFEGPELLSEALMVEPGVFHSQENKTASDVFFLEYETPSEKADLVRYKDRYGREAKGYEGKSQMMPFEHFDTDFKGIIASVVKLIPRKVA